LEKNNFVSQIKIYIDADGCPVKEETYKVAARYHLKVFVVANSWMNIPMDPQIEMVVVDAGPDIADDWIAEHIQEDDICITADIPLADRCIKKKARVLGTKGIEFTEDGIGSALATRELMSHLRSMGDHRGGPAPMEKKDRSQFLSKLDQIVQSIRLKKK
jgi:uncharacterized protein YaiI (UPF0178 family)